MFKKYKKIKIILTKKLLNISDSLNIALKIARGEFIARLDFDDIYLKDKIKKQVNYLTYTMTLNKKKSEITVCILNRSRHSKIINELKRLNVNIKFISDDKKITYF